MNPNPKQKHEFVAYGMVNAIGIANRRLNRDRKIGLTRSKPGLSPERCIRFALCSSKSFRREEERDTTGHANGSCVMFSRGTELCSP